MKKKTITTVKGIYCGLRGWGDKYEEYFCAKSHELKREDVDINLDLVVSQVKIDVELSERTGDEEVKRVERYGFLWLRKREVVEFHYTTKETITPFYEIIMMNDDKYRTGEPVI